MLRSGADGACDDMVASLQRLGYETCAVSINEARKTFALQTCLLCTADKMPVRSSASKAMPTALQCGRS